MKIVIDIDENEYRHIKEIYEKNDIVESTYSYIYHGTPLEEEKECATCKYHGTPFDEEPCSWCGNDCRNYERG